MGMMEDITFEDAVTVDADTAVRERSQRLYKVFMHYAKPHVVKPNGAYAMPAEFINIVSQVFNRGPETLAAEFVELFENEKAVIFETSNRDIAETKVQIANERAKKELGAPFDSQMYFSFEIA